MDLVLRLAPVRTYLTDIPHETSHECWLHFCRAFGNSQYPRDSLPGTKGMPDLRQAPDFPHEHAEGETQPKTQYVYQGLDPRAEDFRLFTERALEAVEDWVGGWVRSSWIRPLADGMTISWRDGQNVTWAEESVWDDEYESDEE